jgi:hypothetical protein
MYLSSQVKSAGTDASLSNGVQEVYPIGSIFPLSLQLSIDGLQPLTSYAGICMYIFIYLFIYLNRNKCTFMFTYVCIYIYTFIYSHTYIFSYCRSLLLHGDCLWHWELPSSGNWICVYICVCVYI